MYSYLQTLDGVLGISTFYFAPSLLMLTMKIPAQIPEDFPTVGIWTAGHGDTVGMYSDSF